MFNNILVISDNAYLCRKLENILTEKLSPEQRVNFSISPFSDINDFNESIKSEVMILDLKKEIDINFIIEHYDLVLSIHCKQFFPNILVQKIKCINIHPGYNPINRGWYPQVFSIQNNLPVGATIHEIDEELDHGPIIDRDFVKKESYDTSGSLYDKILEKEIDLFNKNIDSILNNTYKTILPENEGNLFLKKDFNKLCKIDLKEETTAGKFIDKLRALSHKNFKNAYYIDPENGEKIFISLTFKRQND
ncbi:dTDP-4-amino-4,6-dideoxyglucose formyltransferase [Chryseobacterium shandongense]|jgi:methionyl-tRNA formyltransferase|uniref:dTDP-4-amino-4,6-dideoxyglucose formyltransferase n=1 Tax=Chryseobacterium shandongense TaxID=1493872 RepID=A0A3G6QXD0_9FLAO|nr:MULTISPECIES: dTDP-4-amino-4,6-dideoxyglucose formyltransferase [Chryseobacterium]AZA59064.1 dTDP-4-amino-4,6-dideoxyglucose formyltransferase [Chryseobacterium shandongense]AZA87209.1 dTDP-4-amino-4,6-dideoxyglucose formyltransferase [Chryseobacterium shandongense]AZA95708.1 dTDP-4-amino-4,6-dideoxyglucose formyltransferase [Chryseobacterium shandongense]